MLSKIDFCCFESVLNDKIAVNFATDVPISVFYIKVKRRDVYPFFERAVYDKIAIFGTQLRQLYSLMAWRLTAALVADIKIVLRHTHAICRLLCFAYQDVKKHKFQREAAAV